MRPQLPRTSITEDEAVWILLGYSTGPIEFESSEDDEELDANAPTFDLEESLGDEHDVLEGQYQLAKLEKQPAHVIKQKAAALRRQEAVVEQAHAYLCAIRDELAKRDKSALRVDTALSNKAYTYITLVSFREWAKSLSRSKRGKQRKPPRTTMRDQEDAIYDEVVRQRYDPAALPPYNSPKGGAKAAVYAVLGETPLFKGEKKFDAAWWRLLKKKRLVNTSQRSTYK